MRRFLFLAAVVLGAVAAPAQAATPFIHAHRGGTVLNGKPKYAEESLAAYRNAARNDFVLEADAKLTEDGVPVALHDATLDRTTNCTGEVRTFTLAELAGCRTDVLGSPGWPAADPPSVEAGADHHDPVTAGLRPEERLDREPRDQERADRPGLRLDVRVREQGDGRGDREPDPARPADHPELHPAEPRRRGAAAAGGGDEPAVAPVPQRGLPPAGLRQRLRHHLAGVAGERRLRPPRSPERSRCDPVHARH